MNLVQKIYKKSLRTTVDFVGTKLSRPVLVLLYHRVIESSRDLQQLSVSPANFSEQMKYLRSSCNVLRFEEDWSGVTSPSVVITFDDGYHDNYLNALPILTEYDIPATFFIATGYIGTKEEFWPDELDRILFDAPKYRTTYSSEIIPQLTEIPSGSAEAREALYYRLHYYVKKMNAESRAAFISELRSWAGVGKDGRAANRAMTVEELKSFAGHSQVTIGAHTINHVSLSSISKNEQESEIIGSRQQLERWINKDVQTFAYPYGTLSDYNFQTLSICSAAGYTKVAANYPALAHAWTPKYEIPRVVVRDWPLENFKKCIDRYLNTATHENSRK